MSTLDTVAISLGILFGLTVITIISVIFWQSGEDSREYKKMIKSQERRDEILARASDIESRANKRGLAKSDSPEAKALKYSISEINSLGRDGRRTLDKIEEVNSRLDGEFEAFLASAEAPAS